MSIKALYALITSSALYKLKYNNKIVGMRAKVYDRETNGYLYYDFATSLITDSNLQKFLKDNQSKFESLPLIETHKEMLNADGTRSEMMVLLTQDELDNNQQILEFKSEKDAETVIQSLVEIYKVKEMETTE